MGKSLWKGVLGFLKTPVSNGGSNAPKGCQPPINRTKEEEVV